MASTHSSKIAVVPWIACLLLFTMRCLHQWQNRQQHSRICEQHDLERTPISALFVPIRRNLGQTTPYRYEPRKDHACWRDGPSNQSSWSCLITTFCSGCTNVSPFVPGDRPPSTHGCAPREIPHGHACVCGPGLHDRHPPNQPPQHRHQIWHHRWYNLHLRLRYWSFPSSLPISEQVVQDSVKPQFKLRSPYELPVSGARMQGLSHQGVVALAIGDEYVRVING